MTIAASVQDFLASQGVRYDTILHERTRDSSHSAQAAHVPGDQLAKCVMLEDDNGYLMAVIPASRKVDLGALHRELNRELGLATERELTELFRDCEPGAIPPLGQVYGIDMVVDRTLADIPHVYFEAGDHMSLIHVSGRDFLKLIADCPQRSISSGLTGTKAALPPEARA
jgi:Ala-tRNA(Pro) deacylase